MSKTVTFENEYSFDELAKEMLDAGYPASATLGQLAARRVEDADDADQVIVLDCAVDEYNVLEDVSEDAILEAADDIRASARLDEIAIEDGIRYVRSGEPVLALAMFARVFKGVDYAAVERALNS